MTCIQWQYQYNDGAWIGLSGTNPYATLSASANVGKYRFHARNGPNDTWKQTVALYVVSCGVNMTAYRPRTEPFKWFNYSIPEDDEEYPGAGIRINGDDNNNNLIKVALEVEPAPAPSGLEYVLKRSNSNIKVWDDQYKNTVILDSNDEEVIDISSNPRNVFVENLSGGSAFLELQLRETGETTPISFDTIKFYPFTSVVIVLGGEDQPPTDGGEGTFVIGRNLYLYGYDVHMFDEDNVGNNGAGDVYNEIVNAVQKRNVNKIAIFGYSHGGGSTHDLAERLNNNRTTIGTFTISFTGYIDAVKNWSDIDMRAEDRMPPGASHLANYYQIGVSDPNDFYFDYDLDGTEITGAENHNLDENGQIVTHQTIDDHSNVENGIISSLESRITEK